MKIWFHPYSLAPNSKLNFSAKVAAREGALLRIEFPELNQFGHADLHPWTEFGDEPLKVQLQKLASGEQSPLIKQSLALASEEAQARAEGRSLFLQDIDLKNNFTVPNILHDSAELLTEARESGFETIKLKAGNRPTPEYSLLKNAFEMGLKVRLDFNAKLNQPAFEDYFKHLSKQILSCVEYIEDPFRFDVSSWTRLNSTVPLALDNEIRNVPGSVEAKTTSLDKNAISVLIIKPAKSSVEQSLRVCQLNNWKATVTSYMDHPVGSLHAWAQALKAKKLFPEIVQQAGCATHGLFETNAFSENIKVLNAQIIPPQGLGLGLDEQFERLPWQALSRLT